MKSLDVREMFQEAAERFGDRVAFSSGALSVTYTELDRAADHVASLLLDRGVTKGSAVAILSSRSFDYALGILAVLKAGGLFVPLDPRTPPRRLAAMLEVTPPRCFLIGEGDGGLIATGTLGGAEVVMLSGAPETNGAGAMPRVEIGPDDACYVYFTSGSTGQPKGIAGRYKSIAHFIRWEIETLGLEEGWRVSQLTAPSFDAFLRDLFTPLCAGGTLCAPESREIAMDAERLSDWLAAARVNVVHTVPSLFRTLLHASPPRSLPDLRWVLLAGEPLLPSDVKRWTELHGTSARLVNLYGPSETTMTKLFHLVEPGDGEKRSVPIGKPMPGARALVLDARGKPCPPRGVGEIHIRTPYRSLGYVGREDLTRQVFLPNPFTGDPEDLIYKTGDLGRMLEDGSLEFLGRRDSQVKIRGVRIELPEIEDLLLMHEGVREAAVVDREDGSGTRSLCAYVVADAPLNGPELRDFLARSLPEHSLPSLFVALDALPRTLSGKVDRRALPEPGKIRSEMAAGAVPPRSGTEEMIAGLFARVLGLERVGVHDSFFASGGHSLLATQLLSQVRAAFEVEIPLRRLFEKPTVAGLASAVEEMLRGGEATPFPPLEPVPRNEPLPLSFAQERLWVLDRLQPGGSLYNIPLAVRFEGALDPRVLTAALAGIARRHETLRTTFQVSGGRPRQVVGPEPDLVPRWVDLRALPAERREAEAAAGMAAEARRPFDLSRGPLARVVLFQTGEREHLGSLTMHHIASDAWSLGVFLRELAALYRASAEGQPASLPALPVQYADFAVWQRSWLAGAALDRQMEYWKGCLSGERETLELPADRPRSAQPGFRGARSRTLLGRELSSRLQELAAGQGATLFMVAMAGFLTWIHRVTARQRIDVGAPVANRSRAELEGLIGFFVNTLVLRTEVAEDLTFRTLLSRVRETSLGAYAHQDMPFEKLVEELRPERDLARNPLFQVMLAFQNVPREPLDLPGVKLTPVPLDAGTARFDLTLYFAEEDAGIALHAEYAAELFDRPTIGRMLRQLESLLDSAARRPELGLWELALLREEERQQLVLEWNDTAGRVAAAGSLHGPIAAWADAQPHAPAVLWEGGSLSYGELERRANHLAHRLCALGVAADVPVGLCVERSAAMIVGLLGILKAGGAYVPLDPAHPEERLRFMLDDSRAPVLLAQRGLAGHLPTGGARVLFLEELEPSEAAPDRRWAEAPAGPILPDQAAYVIYTSGSTGRPKGVVVSHRAICNRLEWMPGIHPLSTEDRILQKTPFSFDVSVWELFWPLRSGARLVLARPGGHRDPAYLLRRIVEEQISVVHFVPPMLRVFLEVSGLAEARSLRLVICSGEALGSDLQERFFARLAARLYNLYGPTEAAVEVTCWPCEQGVPGVVPIGRPIANTQIRVLDPLMEPMPVGVPGELYIGGVNLARGYLDRPALTAERFLPDPLGEAPGCRLYRTGDLARHRPDGAVEFLGRLDHQVKIRGFRIELGEIESVLSGHAGVREGRVLVRGEGEERHLVAYVVPSGEVAPEVGALRSWAARELPDYMVPADFVFLDTLPLTTHGKVDMQALAAIAPAERRETAGAFLEPRDRTEELLAGIWAEVLGREKIGAHDDFFASGGHSLLGMQVISRLREVFGVEFPLRDLFEAPVLAALARRVAAAQGVLPRGPRIERASRRGELPLSFGQQRLWFLAQLEPENPAYNLPAALRLEGELRMHPLQRALDEIVGRHEVLRTAYPAIGGRPWQRIAATGTAGLPLVDLGALPERRRAAAAERLLADEARRPFRLDRGPVLRATLVRLAAGDHLALITMHHVASDGWSWPIFIREMAALYAAFSAGEPSPLPGLPVQYADFASWQRSWLAGEALAAELDHWRERLCGAPSLLELPLDRPRPALRRWRGDVRSLVLSEELSRDLVRISRREGVTLFMTLLAAFQALLRRHGAQERIPVGSPIAGRNRLELEPLIGFFVNTLVLSTDLGGDPSFRELLARVREATLDGDAHQELPFEKLVEELEPERNLSHTPLFQVMLAFQAALPEVPDLGGLRVSPLRSATGTAKFDLTLTVRQESARVDLELEYADELFDGATAGRMLLRLERLLAGAAADPGRRLSDLPLLGEEERHQILYAWNETAAAETGGLLLHQLFELQAERRPEAVALVSACGERLTYAELDRRADSLARRLSDCGVGRDVPVGLYIERSPELVIGLLGILKAGGAYVPLDPSYPRNRLAFLLEDSAVPVLLTSERLASTLPGHGARVLCLDEGDHPAARLAVQRKAPAAASPDSLAYVIYTSGSTGQPKGAGVRQSGLAVLLRWYVTEFEMGVDDRILVISSFGFDLTQKNFFAPLLLGGQLHLAPSGPYDPQSLAETIERQGITRLNCTPSAFYPLVEGEGLPSRLASLRSVFLGGEPISTARLEAWRRSRECCAEIVNTYGPTECTDVVAFHRLPAPGDTAFAPVPIGRPVLGARLYVLDDRLEPAPAGVAGELHIAGEGVGRGYLDQPDMTAERFLPDPFGSLPGGRLYRTGDLVRHRADGNLEFLGRLDQQVKVHGFRIEPGEIEAALLRSAGVREAVVVAREDLPGDRKLVAYLVTEPGAQLPHAQLRELLRESLPPHMIPASFVHLSSLPLTPSGKVDRLALPAPDSTRPDLSDGYVRPETAVERRLAAIWTEVLRVEPIGLHDNFFQLGGDSILSIQVVSKAGRAGLRITPWQIFEHQTIAALAAVAGVADRPGARREAMTGEVPLTAVQHWFFAAEPVDPHHFNQSVLLEGPATIDGGLLHDAVAHLLCHHDALRLRFERGEAGWRQIGQPATGEPPFLCVDLAALPAERRPAAQVAAAADLQGSLDFDQGRLVRVALFRGGSGQPSRVLLVIHHLVVDGVSWRILLEDLETAYAQLENGAPVELTPTTSSYGEWAGRLAGHAASRVEHELAFWTAPSRREAARLPYDEEGEDTVASEGRLTVSLEAGETAALLKEVPQAYRTQINDVLLTALAQSFAAWSGERSLLIDLEGHGRESIFEDLDLSRTVGWFTSIFPVLLDLEGAGDPGEALIAVKEQLRAIPERGIGYGLLRYLAGDEAAALLRALPAAEVGFNYLGQLDSTFSASGPFRPADGPTGPLRSPRQHRRYPIEVIALVLGGRLQATFSYSRNRHRPATLKRVADGFLNALRDLIEHCNSPWSRAVTPSDFPLANLSQEQLAKALGQVGQAKV